MKIETCAAAGLPELLDKMSALYGADAVLLSVRRIAGPRGAAASLVGRVGMRSDTHAPIRPLAHNLTWNSDLILSGAVMLGPPGSGKTTTAAKIAAQVSAHTRGDVGMISTDTQRPGGAALMLAYADALDVYATSAASASDLQNRVTQWNSRGPLIVDTHGISPHEPEALRGLDTWLEALGGQVCRLLVLSATDNLAVVREWLGLYEDLKLGGVIVTKTDLDSHGGACVAEVKGRRLPLAFIGTGGNVPGDLELAG